MFEGVDYEVSQLNELSLPALVTIINADLHSATITADYYCWKTGLSVEQIVSGLLALAGYDSENEDIRSVVWNNQVRTQRALSSVLTLGYNATSNTFTYKGNNVFYGGTLGANSSYYRYSQLNNNCKLSFVAPYSKGSKLWRYFLGDLNNSQPYNGIEMHAFQTTFLDRVAYAFYSYSNGNATTLGQYNGQTLYLDITIQNGNITINANGSIFTTTVNFSGSGEYNEKLYNQTNVGFAVFSSNTLQDLKTGATIEQEGIIFSPVQKITQSDVWVAFQTELENHLAQYQLKYLTSEDNNTWSTPSPISIGSYIGKTTEYIQFLIYITTLEKGNILNSQADVLTNELSVQLVNLSGKTVLEALQDFALISGYEFGVDRQGVFFFRPRSQSTTPIYDLDSNEIVKIDNINKKFNDFFTKLTLTFAQVPLEFYANEGERPTPIDKYGVINKEIDKPDIVNYDNPELAQAIGPQLLAIYSNLADIIQLTGKLNLSLELGDIINVKRNYNLTAPESASDYDKFICQNTYYQAAKITGLNYNFGKRQITYTLRNVSNSNNQPQPPVSSNQFPYDLPINF